MECNRCGNPAAYAMRFTASGESCNQCGGFTPRGSPDCYFREPYLDPNLPHPNRPAEKDGVWVTSKRHKQQLLNEQGLYEKGDRKHGARDYNKSVSETERRARGIRD